MEGESASAPTVSGRRGTASSGRRQETSPSWPVGGPIPARAGLGVGQHYLEKTSSDNAKQPLPPAGPKRVPGSWAVSIDVTSGKSNLSLAVAGPLSSRDISSREICLLTLAMTSSSSSPSPFGNLRQSQPRPICTQIV